MNDVIKKSGRGKGVKPAMIKISLRVPKDVLDFYKSKSPAFTKAIREVLEAAARQ